jgi:hypothetical protein
MSALLPKADIKLGPRYVHRNNSGRLAIFAAIRRAAMSAAYEFRFSECLANVIEIYLIRLVRYIVMRSIRQLSGVQTCWWRGTLPI